MKKHIYKSVAALFLTSLALTSCSDFLDAENKSSGGNNADSYFSKDASEYLVTAYNSVKSLVNQVDIYEHGTDLYFNTRGHGPGDFNDYSLTAENGTVQSFYTNAYSLINNANGVIHYAGADSQEGYEARFLRNFGYYLLTQQFGSVYYSEEFINNSNRDYPRTDLSEVYEKVIADLTDLYNNSSLAAQSKDGHANKQAVAALLAKLYLAAGWDLHTTLDNAEQGTYTVNNREYFNQAAQWAERAINGVSLTMSFEDKWSPFNEGNAEEIWAVQYDRATYPGDVSSGGHSFQNSYGGYFGNMQDFGLKYTGSDNQPRAKVLRLFSKGDARYDATFMTTYYNSTKAGTAPAEWGTNGYYAYYNLSAADLENHPIAFRYYPAYMTQQEVEADLTAHKAQFAKYANQPQTPTAVRLDDNSSVLVYSFNDDGSFKSPATQTYEFYIEQTNAFGSVKKFDDPESQMETKNNDYRDIIVFHVSDMYLVAAEAYFMAGNNTAAIEKINAVRKRAGAAELASFADYEPEYIVSSSFAQKDIDLILDERARELYAERQRWMDLRRTKQLVRYNVEFNKYISGAADMCNAKGEFKWYRPIPAVEISSNTGITTDDQNPGY